MYFFKKRFSLCIIPAVCHNPKDTFLEFYMRSHSKIQFVIPNWRYVRSESYFNFMAEKGLYRFSLFITPNVCDILLAIFYVYEFQFIYPFTVNPRKLKSVTHSIRMLFILRRGISFSLCPLTVIEYHDFNFLYNESLFMASQSAILFVLKLLSNSIFPSHSLENYFHYHFYYYHHYHYHYHYYCYYYHYYWSI